MALSSKDVAARAGVSRSTVSYVLNGHGERFSPETRKAVEDAVEALGYRPQAAGRALARGQSDVVVLVMPVFANLSLSGLLDELADELAGHGLSLLLRSASASASSLQTVIATVRPCAVIALSDLSDKDRALLVSADIYLMEIARELSKPGGLNWQIGRIQAEHLYERGFRRVAYARLAEAGDDILQEARERGVRDTCALLGLPEVPEIHVRLRADEDLDVIRSLAEGTGVACYNDDTASALLGAANVVQRCVPGDLGLIGADDTPVATQTTPRLTTLSFRSSTFAPDMAARVVHRDMGPATITALGDLITLKQGGTT